MTTSEERILAELRQVRGELSAIRAAMGDKTRRKWITGAQAARLMGVCYKTFKTRYVNTGYLIPSGGGKFQRRKVEDLATSEEESLIPNR